MMFSQKQRIAIVEFYFAIKSHCRVINAFQKKYPGETAPKTSTITLLVQWFSDTRSVANRKQSGRASVVKTKVPDVETALERSPLKRPSVYINIITEFIYFLKVMKGTLDRSKAAQRVTNHGTDYETANGDVSSLETVADQPATTTKAVDRSLSLPQYIAWRKLNREHLHQCHFHRVQESTEDCFVMQTSPIGCLNRV
ncbi:DUF4817 domain-containing protein [Trichonephila clavipes]|nr:DUF4817 domain-containing protein [Trichonephila clavipes]